MMNWHICNNLHMIQMIYFIHAYRVLKTLQNCVFDTTTTARNSLWIRLSLFVCLLFLCLININTQTHQRHRERMAQCMGQGQLCIFYTAEFVSFISVFVLHFLLTKLSPFFSVLGARSLAGGRRMYGRSDRALLWYTCCASFHTIGLSSGKAACCG